MDGYIIVSLFHSSGITGRFGKWGTGYYRSYSENT